MERPKLVDVEKEINQFVIENNGSLVTSLFKNNIQTNNADYFFEIDNVIAELKCFQKDLFNSSEDADRIVSILQNWVNQNLILQEDVIKYIVGRKSLPEKCNFELITIASKTIENAIRKGNKQIRETKKLLNKPNAKGLLLLCNDGNYFFQNNLFYKIICDIMERKYKNSDVDGFVYFTYNQTSLVPESELDQQLWAPAYKNEQDELFGDFVNDLGEKFFKHINKTLGDNIEINKLDTLEKGIEFINKMKYISKEITFKSRKN